MGAGIAFVFGLLVGIALTAIGYHLPESYHPSERTKSKLNERKSKRSLKRALASADKVLKAERERMRKAELKHRGPPSVT